jgi:fatty-acyl-CoA synthase
MQINDDYPPLWVGSQQRRPPIRPTDYFDKGANRNLNATAIICGNTSYSYQEVSTASHQIAAVLSSSAGFHQEDRVAIYSPNDPRVLVCMLGIMRAGGVCVPVNARNSVSVNVDQMRHAQTTWLFYHSQFSGRIKEITAGVPTLRQCVCLDSQDGGIPSLDDFMAGGSNQEEIDWGDPCGNPDRLVMLSSTGGTTGASKAVQLTSLAWATMIEMAARYWGCADPVVCLSVAPLTHGAKWLAMLTFYLGGTNVVMASFDALEVLRAIEEYRVTHLFLPPTAFYTLLAHPEVEKFDYSSLRVFLLAGSPVSPDKLRRGIKLFGPALCESYGQAEAPMMLTWLDGQTLAAAAAGEHPERLTSCGKETYGVRVAVMDDQGRLLPPHQHGEIVARGHLVTPGYYKNPEATTEAQKYGWLHTGDIGYMDEDGYYYIVDRKKDMIITGGFNVYSAEVEAAIMELSQVRECVVIGVPDEKWGEAVKAIVAFREGQSLTESVVIEHCKARLGHVKAPKSVEIKPGLPTTSVGKVDKAALRKPHWANVARAVH